MNQRIGRIQSSPLCSLIAVAGLMILSGCMTSTISKRVRESKSVEVAHKPSLTETHNFGSPKAEIAAASSQPETGQNQTSENRGDEIVLANATDEDPPQPTNSPVTAVVPRGSRLRPNLMPIDLATVVRLVRSNSPLVGFTQAKVREAYARAEASDLLWLPNLSAGVAYNRFDGQTQNQRGDIFSVSRSNLFPNAGVSLNLDTSDAYYKPLIEWQNASAENRRASAVTDAAVLDAVLAYWDLLQAHEQIEINADTLKKGEELLEAAKNAQVAKADRSPGDVNRVRTEVLLRRQERVDLEGRSAAAAARLGQLLLIDPFVTLVPQVVEVVPIRIVDTSVPVGDLLAIASHNRQDLAASHEQIAAAWERVRKAKYGPLLPKLQVTNQSGVFGGGINDEVDDFKGRNTVSALMYWELRNLGFGNCAEECERQAGLDQAHFQRAEVQARIAAQIVESAEIALAKEKSLELAKEAVSEATELYRINRGEPFKVVDANNLFDALRPLQAIQILHQTQQNYLSAVIDYNRAQYRLHSYLGCPINDDTVDNSR